MRVRIPAEIRDQLKTIASRVAQAALGAYRKNEGSRVRGKPDRGGMKGKRDHCETGRAGPQITTGGRDQRDDLVPWSIVEDVLGRELAAHPGVLGRIMAAQADAGVRPRGRDAGTA